jgi:glycosyltransferase involved in cell wall biosynthesis
MAAVRRAGVDVDAPGVVWENLNERKALARAYGEAWVAVLPSQHEAFGLVLVEAMACGTPVVGHAHGAIPEVVSDEGLGRLFEELTVKSVADAILDAMPLSAMPGTAARCRARAEEFSTERCTQRYLDLYRELGSTAC